MTWQGFLLGMILGVAVGFFHDRVLAVVQKRQENIQAKHCVACFFFRSLTVIIIFLLIYRNLGLLVGTATGLIIVKKVWLAKEYLTSKKRLKK